MINMGRAVHSEDASQMRWAKHMGEISFEFDSIKNNVSWVS
jgi:hypothetical protein